MKRRLILLVSLLLLSLVAADAQMLPHRRKAFRSVGGAPLGRHSSAGSTGINMTDATAQALTTTSALSNGYIVVAVVFWDANAASDVVTCSFDGSGMTELADFNFGSTSQCYIFGLAVGSKASGTYNATFDVSETLSEWTLFAAAYNGVHQTTPVGTTATANNPGTTQTLSSIAVASNATDLIFDALIADQGEIATPTGTGHIELYEAAPQSRTTGAFGEMPGVATTTTVTWTFVGQPWLGAGFALKPAP